MFSFASFRDRAASLTIYRVYGGSMCAMEMCRKHRVVPHLLDGSLELSDAVMDVESRLGGTLVVTHLSQHSASTAARSSSERFCQPG